MKHKLLLSLLLAIASCAVAFADKTENYVLFEGFEGASVPTDWTQENVSGSEAWVVEAGATGTYPVGAYQGNYRAALRNTTAQTLGFVTKLISPVIDLTNVYQPILVFSRAQMQRTGDVDTLKVYYRTSSEGRWVKIAEYGQKTLAWETDTIPLTGANATYQIAFEGTDNMGRGIVLDDIIVRPMPTCDNPSNITIDGLTVNAATLRWLGSLDTDSFHVVISASSIDDLTNIPASVEVSAYVSDFQLATGSILNRNSTYHVYVQAHCGNEESGWAHSTFTTKNLVSLPYKQTFDMPYVTGTVSHVSYWTHGTNITREDGVTMEYMPFVNQNTSATSLDDYSYNATTCLVFTGARSTSTEIPAGQYVYAATPELDVTSLQGLQVRFWGTCYSYVDGYAHGITVGAMTDPADFSTFEPIQTVYVNEPKSFKEFTVPFENYTGSGKYIAFASNFIDKPNIFYLDQVEIKVKDALVKPTIESVSKTQAHSFMIHANVQGATTYNVRVAKAGLDPIMDPTNISADSLIVDITGATGSDYVVNLPATYNDGRFVQVYVQTVNGADRSEWSLPYKVLLPRFLQANSVSLLMDFNTSEYTNDDGGWQSNQVAYFSSVSSTYHFSYNQLTYAQLKPVGGMEPYMDRTAWPYLYSTTAANAYNGSGSAYLVKERLENTSTTTKVLAQPVGGYFVLPQIDTVQNVMLKFYLRNYSTSVANTSRVAVGVMSDPADVTTFDTVAVFDGELTYKPCVVSFKNYAGTGSMIALMAVEAANEYPASSGSSSAGYSYQTYYTSASYIDYLTLTPAQDCIIPTEMQVTPSYDHADMTWQANGATKWQVQLSTVANMATLMVDTTVTANSLQLNGLAPHTNYYYTMAVICGTDTTWIGDIYSFKSTCLPAELLPYTETFETYQGGSTSQEIPECWTMPLVKYTYSTSTSWYPYIYNYTGSAHTGAKSLYFGTGSVLSKIYFALPQMMTDTLQNLQVSFWAKGASATYNDTLQIGVMTDPDDINTFVKVSDVFIKGNTYKEYLFSLANYAGNGRYIAIYKPNTQTHYYYIDDIEVKYLAECEKVQGVTTRDVAPDGATIAWGNTAATQWQVLVSEQAIDPDTLTLVPDSLLLCNQITNTNPYVFNSPDAMVNTTYYVYVRALCDNGAKGDWSNQITFKTTCTPTTIAAFGVEDFADANALGCWTVGVREGTTAVPNRSSETLYMFTSTTSDGAYAIMPPIDIDSIARLQVSFDAWTTSTVATNVKRVTVGVISNAEDLSTFTALKTVKYDNAVSGAAPRYTVRLNEYMGDYNEDYGKQVMFIAESGDSTSYVNIDNISFSTIPACLEPLDVVADSVGTYGAHLVWDGEATGNYQVKVSNKSINPVTALANVLDTIVTGNQVLVENLEMLQNYKVYVRTICGAGDTSLWSNERDFTTECPASYALPYADYFDTYATGTGKRPSCWTSYYGTTEATSSYPYVNTTSYEGSGAFYLYSASATNISTVASPKLEGNMSQAMLSFYYRGSAANKVMIVGVAENVENLDTLNATVQWLDTLIAASTTYTKYQLPMTAYTGNGGYVVLKNFVGTINGTSYTSGGMYVDNFEVEMIPTCFKPEALQMTTKSESTLSVSWTEPRTATQWEVVCVPADADVTTGTIVSVDTTAYTFTGLTASTNYDIYVRSVCSPADVSVWVSLLDQKTTAVPATSPYVHDFENETENSQWTIAAPTTNKWFIGSTFGQGDSKALYVSATENDTIYNMTAGSAWASRNITLPSGVYTMSLVWRAGGESSYDFMRVGLVPQDNKLAASTGQGVVTTPEGVATTMSATAVPTEWLNVGNKLNLSTQWDTLSVDVVVYDDETYNMAFYWRNDASGGVQPGALVDNLSVIPADICYPVYDITADPSDISAELAWKQVGYQSVTWEVKVANEAIANDAVDAATAPTVVFAQQNLLTPMCSVTGLTSNTDYYAYVRAKDNTGRYSEWTRFDFTTPCAPIADTLATWNFEDNLYQYGTSTTYMLPDCWQEGLETGTTAGNHPYAVLNTTTYNYAKGATTTDRSLRFYTTTSNYNAYVVLPEIDKPLDSLALHFYGRAAYFYSPTYNTVTNRNRLYTANANYSRTLIMGTLTDVDDISTFEPLDTIIYPNAWSSTTSVYSTVDENNNDYWTEYTMPLAKYAGKRIVLLAPKPTATSYFFVDDLSIVPGDFCSSVSNLRATNTTGNSGTLAWATTGSPDVALQISTSENFDSASIIYNDTLNVSTYMVTGLTPGTTYYARALHLCGDGEQSDWQNTSFNTYYAVRFNEPFEINANYPENWTRYVKSADEVFAGASLGTPQGETATSAWKRGFAGIGMPSTHMVLNVYSTSAKYWLISPSIDLTTLTASDSLMLSFDLSMSDGVDHQGARPSLAGDDDRFIVAVSTDNGATWTENNAYVWDNAGAGDYVYNEISPNNGGSKVFLDFSAYAGNVIQIGFYGESTVTNADNDLHLDNVQLNRSTQKDYAMQICQYSDYADANFTLDASQIEVGENKFSSFKASNSDAQKDELTVLTLTSDSASNTTLRATRCEGETYTDNNFNITVTSSGVYKQKLQGTNTCDSIVTLYLTANPILRSETRATICQGSSYQWHGVDYYRTAIVSDTLSSVTTGCDSITTLYLTVRAALESAQTVTLCYGGTLSFGKYTNITEGGTYIDTLQTAEGCDSIVTLTVVASPELKTTVRAAICQGDSYNDGTFVGLTRTGSYTVTIPSVAGCDSTVTLKLTVANTIPFTLQDTISANELPYVFNGETLWQVGTPDGDYTTSVNLPCGTMTLNLHIGTNTGISTTAAQRLQVAPNPVAVNKPITVYGDFTAAEREGMTVKVFNSLGALVYVDEPTLYPMTIAGLPMSGVYVVSVTTGTKQVYRAKVIVE